MKHNPEEVAARVREMREVLELDPAEVARRMDVTVEQYYDYENCKASIPISKLYCLAGIFNVDFTLLMTGESARMTDYTIVRSNQRIDVDRYPGYSFEALAFNYIGRKMEPLLVEMDDKSAEAPLVSHGGQEFNFVLEGKIKVTVGDHDFILGKGDSCYFNPSIPHGQHAVEGPAKFLTVILNN